MQVEVNEQNIVTYGLVQWTGNSAAEMLEAAAAAAKDGYVLTCYVPDFFEPDLVELNVFDVVDGEVVDPELTHDGVSPYEAEKPTNGD